jgi:hypothetical protein
MICTSTFFIRVEILRDINHPNMVNFIEVGSMIRQTLSGK